MPRYLYSFTLEMPSISFFVSLVFLLDLYILKSVGDISDPWSTPFFISISSESDSILV